MLNKLEDNNMGATSYVERTLMYVIIFFVTTFALDLIFLACTMIVANHQLGYVCSKLEYQNGFIGQNSSLNDSSLAWSNKVIHDYLDAGMKSVGIDGVTYAWALFIDEDVEDNIGYQKIFQSNATCHYDYQTPNNYRLPGKQTITNYEDLQKQNSLYRSSGLKLSFDYKYRFSGKAFKFLHILTTMSLSQTYKNMGV